jgi:hypothetical protein
MFTGVPITKEYGDAVKIDNGIVQVLEDTIEETEPSQ